MARVEAVELVAHGIACDRIGCEKVVRTRNAQSKKGTEGWYFIKDEHVTPGGYLYSSPELAFCSKEHMLEALKWEFSSLTNNNQGKA